MTSSVTGQSASAIVVIPARFGSTRFPGKPLANRTGKPLIQHVVERVRQARRVERIVVATDDRRIADAVAAFGTDVLMTRADHPNGTSRIAEVIERLCSNPQSPIPNPQLVVNVQGDEPEIDPAVIDALIDALAGDEQAAMATVASPFAADEDPADPNIVKVVVSRSRRALYFSRSAIPFHRDGTQGAAGTSSSPGDSHAGFLKHVGIYAYRAAFLRRYVAWTPTPLEQAEQLEQLRVLEHGETIAVVQCRVDHHGIDTPEQYEAFVQRKTKKQENKKAKNSEP